MTGKRVIDAELGPFARRAMACAAWGGKVYFFGGVGSRGKESILDVDAELWSLDPAGWRWAYLGGKAGDAPQAWPGPRRCCGFAETLDGISMWGGSGLSGPGSATPSYTFLNDLWKLTPADGRWQLLEDTDDFRNSPGDSARPVPRYTPLWRFLGPTGVLFGGYTEDLLGKRKLNDLWLREAASGRWESVTASAPHAGDPKPPTWPGVRYGAMSAQSEGSVYVCGGFSDAGDHIDLWAWDAHQRSWRCLWPDEESANSPSKRYCAACTFQEDAIWLFGGRSRRFPKHNYNDTWRFDLRTGQWALVDPQDLDHDYSAGARHIGYHAKAASAVVNGSWILWGGEGRRGHVSDLWKFDFQTKRWQMLQPARADDPVLW